MTTYKILQVILFSYSAVCVFVTFFFLTFEIAFGQSKGKEKLHRLLSKLRGNVTILLPLRIFSVIAIFSWLAIALPLIDGIFIGTNYFAHIQDGTLVTWFGNFSGKQGDYYFFTAFCNIIAVKGYFLIKEIADILSDDSLAINRYGNLTYKKKLFL
jgi:hypothetical protein